MNNVISIDELRNQATEVIAISPFTGENDINVIVKRLSILGLCTEGVIPNPLLSVARRLFYQDKVEELDLKEYGSVIDILCKQTLVDPSVEQLKSLDMKLTDEQRFEIYFYAQGGVKGLENFRSVAKNTVSTNDVEKLQTETEPTPEHN